MNKILVAVLMVLWAGSALALSLNPAEWNIRYSSGFGLHPDQTKDGWALNFSGNKEADYVVRAAKIAAGAGASSIELTIRVVGTFTATGGGTPAATIILQRKGDNLSGSGKYIDYRLWCGSNRIALRPGTFTVTCPLTPSAWTNVFGKKPSNSGWAGTLKNLQNAGVTFGGMFFGHGVRGNGSVTVTQFDIK